MKDKYERVMGQSADKSIRIECCEYDWGYEVCMAEPVSDGFIARSFPLSVAMTRNSGEPSLHCSMPMRIAIEFRIIFTMLL